MKVILKEDVQNLGEMGEIVNVSDGYARNFLIPRKLAAVADKKNVRELEHEKRVIDRRADKLKADAQTLADRISAVTINIKAKAGEEEKLFGSVTAMDVAEALKAEGFDVDKKKIVIEEPIKRLGTHAVAVKVGKDVTATVNVEVEAEE
ncbi:MAG: 50S ribosomal protein L9 [Nitrospirota bacterium]